jgi:DNA-binding transcriptional MerR regulator
MLKIGDFSRLSQVSIKALRYYDEIGLLPPAHIDRFTNYRYYSVEQLPRLHRILALKDLGLSLEQVGQVLASEPDHQQIQAMLLEKQAEIEQRVSAEKLRLRRVEARLRQIEREEILPQHEVVVKAVEPQTVATVRDVVPTYEAGEELFETLYGYLAAHGLTLYHDVGYRERDVDMTVAAPIDRPLPDDDPVAITTLPGTDTMLSVVHRGPYDTVSDAYRALMIYLESNRYSIAGPNRMLFLQGWGQTDDPAAFVTEIQFPIRSL